MAQLPPLPLALALAAALAGCSRQPAPPAEPAPPAPAATTAQAPAPTAGDAAPTAGAAPVLGPQPVTALGTGPDGSPLPPMDEAHAPVAAPDHPANDPATHAGTDGILRAQVLLLRQHFSSGEIDGKAGMNLEKAVRGFQAQRGLPVTGKLDDATWTELDKDQAPVLMRYTLTQADIDGPYAPTPARPEDKAKMERIVYQDLLEMLGERYNAKPELLKALNPGADFSSAGTVLVVPYTRPAQQLPKAARIVVDKSDGALQLLDAEGKVYAQFPASSGSSRFPLPIGEWKLVSVVQDPDYRYDPDLLVGQPKDAKPATLPPGPNGPVGIVWMGIDKPHYGIHGTPEPGKISRTQSSGCVRLTNFAAQAVATAVAPGTPVTFRE
ncbi:MAG TPA: L,D-transpeptidase family protein [Thermomonas sp.]|nr:L,D-transpeptidase family protein [Thermomonas sp.]